MGAVLGGDAMNPLLSLIEARATARAWWPRFVAFLLTAALCMAAVSLGRWLVLAVLHG
jgi:hypothetical protein